MGHSCCHPPHCHADDSYCETTPVYSYSSYQTLPPQTQFNQSFMPFPQYPAGHPPPFRSSDPTPFPPPPQQSFGASPPPPMPQFTYPN